MMTELEQAKLLIQEATKRIPLYLVCDGEGGSARAFYQAEWEAELEAVEPQYQLRFAQAIRDEVDELVIQLSRSATPT